ncbi:MAG: transposase [Microthrixaceae bacterium]
MDGVHLDNLNRFRTGLFGCFGRWADTLFELCDATLCATGPVTSLPMLSLEPVSRRSHGSLYRSLAEGEIDTDRFSDLLIAHRPVDWPDVFAVDASTWARCDAETSPQRGFYYSASKHSAGQPIVAGWSYEWVTQLDWAPDSWTAPIDVGRIDPNTNALDQTITRIRRITERLDCDNPMFVFDAGYDPIALTHHLTGTNAQLTVRIRSDRVFYGDPPEPGPHTMGRPRRHGNRLCCI